MEQNSIWWAMMKLWVYSAIACFLTASLIAFLSANYSGVHDAPASALAAGILFFPFVIIAFYGFRNRYFMGHRVGFIYRGLPAQVMNVLSLGLYFVAVGAAYVSWR